MVFSAKTQLHRGLSECITALHLPYDHQYDPSGTNHILEYSTRCQLSELGYVLIRKTLSYTHHIRLENLHCADQFFPFIKYWECILPFPMSG